MIDTFGKANQATQRAATLEQQILDPTHAKNDREWWAADEITRLTARVEELEVEVEAAKKFGGGFYDEAVEEGTREVYRGFARAALEGK